MSVVYFIQAGSDGPIKIGTATDLPRRMEALQCGCPDLMVVLATINGGRNIEARFHRALRGDLHRGEWFRPTEAVLDAVFEAREGRLPPLEAGHGDILRRADLAQIAEATGLSLHTIRAWGRRNSIPARYWFAFIECEAATLPELAASVKQRRRRAA